MTGQSSSVEEEIPLRAAAVQLNATEDTARNLLAAERLTREAVARGAELVVLPEKWHVLGRAEVMAGHAQPLDGKAVTWAREIARETGVDLVAGSILEGRPGAGKHHNTSVHVAPDGELRAAYRKIHLFDVEVDGRAYNESDTEDPGNDVVVSVLADGVELGMSVCYDLRFPELFRILALRGAQVISAPSAFTLATTRDHWEPLVRARAIENQAFVIAANQVGEHPGGYRSGGRSMIVDPWGIVLAQAPDAEAVIVADLDLQRLADIRARLPSLANRRPEAYAWPVEVRA